MKAKLMYQDSFGGGIPLKEMELKELDQYVYHNFSKEVEVINTFLHQGLKEDTKNRGLVHISYVPADLPFTEIYQYALKGAVLTESQPLHVIYGNSLKRPEQLRYKQDIEIMLQDREQVKLLHDLFQDNFTAEEELQYHCGVLKEDPSLYLRGLKRWIREVSSGEEGYFFSRLIANSMYLCPSEEKNKDFSLHDYRTTREYCKK